jgi:hypothetical protein
VGELREARRHRDRRNQHLLNGFGVRSTPAWSAVLQPDTLGRHRMGDLRRLAPLSPLPIDGSC